MNASTALLHALLDRGVYLENFTSSELSKLLPILEKANDEVLGKIAKTGGAWTREWLAEVSAQISAIYGASASEIERRLMPDLEALASDETQDITKTWGNVLVGVSTTTPAAAQLWALIKALPASEGTTLGDLMQAMGVSSSSEIIKALQAGIAEGETNDQLIRRIRGRAIKPARWVKVDGQRVYIPGTYEGGVMAGATTKTAEMLVRTATMHVANQAREAVYAENEDIIKGYQAVATLDLDTCIICGELDGRVYGLNEPRPQYPLHPRCRCLYVPVLKSFRELGIAADLPEATRASMDGQVAASETFADRLAKMTPGQRIAVLGPGRADLYAKGLPLSEMVRDGRLVPLSELSAPRKKGRAA